LLGLNKGEYHVDSIEEYAQALVGAKMFPVTIPVTRPHMPEGFQDLSDQRSKTNRWGEKY
jgi:hypothetical protein